MMRWQEIRELAEMAILLGMLFAAGAGISMATGGAKTAEAADRIENVEIEDAAASELESVQVGEPDEPVLWPSGV